MNGKKPSVRLSIEAALMTAVMAVCAQIALPVPGGVPVTLQTFSVSFCGFLLGGKTGVFSVSLYLLLGFFGIPVFAQFRGGPSILAGVTGGFLIGFLFLAFCSGVGGWYMERGRRAGGIAVCMMGLFLCHLTGMIQFSVVSGTSLVQSFLIALFPYIIKDGISVYFAWGLSCKVKNARKSSR